MLSENLPTSRALAALLTLTITLSGASAFAEDASAGDVYTSMLTTSTVAEVSAGLFELSMVGLLISAAGAAVAGGVSTTTLGTAGALTARKRAVSHYLKENRRCAMSGLTLPNSCTHDLATLAGVPHEHHATFTNTLRANRQALMLTLREGDEAGDARFASRLLALAHPEPPTPLAR